mmetsp:Transcript_26967/g.30067  ORF Transcript_26967/g.30067 Transcript_26967/m.30067 type:complete len:254 (-) Transcript_26967:83-844(-)
MPAQGAPDVLVIPTARKDAFKTGRWTVFVVLIAVVIVIILQLNKPKNTCGNGVLDDSEECDNGTGCTLCKCDDGYIPASTLGCKPKCGNGVLDDREECDGTLYCTPSCQCKQGTISNGSGSCGKHFNVIMDLYEGPFPELFLVKEEHIRDFLQRNGVFVTIVKRDDIKNSQQCTAPLLYVVSISTPRVETYLDEKLCKQTACQGQVTIMPLVPEVHEHVTFPQYSEKCNAKLIPVITNGTTIKADQTLQILSL